MLSWIFHCYNQHTNPKMYFKIISIYVGCDAFSTDFTFVGLSIFVYEQNRALCFDLIHYHYYLHLKYFANLIYLKET